VATESRDVRGYQYLLFAILGSYVVATFEAESTLALSILYLIAPIVIVRHLVRRGRADMQTLYGVICAYAMIGMSFAFCYRLLGIWQPSDFFGAGGDGTMSDDLFFSFTSLTTVGYGNLVPAGNPGQTMAVGKAVLGQLFLVVVVARVVSLMGNRPPRNSEGA